MAYYIPSLCANLQSTSLFPKKDMKSESILNHKQATLGLAGSFEKGDTKH